MGGPGSGRKPEGGGGGGGKSYNHSAVKTAQFNRKYTSSGMPRGGVNYNSSAFKKIAAKQKRSGF